ncbi:hypothetical protein E3T61_13885 [Cryobacterium lactosi]|uniref:Uncharacterized protein n=1 Tax=Cryobacterium lactosi TaxID=1259202 RepID=A0A4R9BLF5_9MICO|nr:LPO_1073/Vpar_1526 family protein [Cryobacterium lactosi]TFD86959.1 hypothetical protein E3T61_13885 [Cryobacterium lactosi]
MSKVPLDQTGGEGSTNLQAGRDVHLHGLTMAEARQVALDVFTANALELRGLAQAVAVSRAEEITNDFLDKLSITNPKSAESLAEPDMQSVLFEAQKEYARSGEEDLKEALIDLLATRAGQTDRDLRTLALNEAILSAPKLTEQQRRAVAWVFFLRYTRDVGSGTPEMFYTRFEEVVVALGTNVPNRHADYQHMEYVGVGTISISSVSFGAATCSGSEGLFTNGFPETTVEGELLARLQGANLVVPCIRNPENIQLNLIAEEELPDRLKGAGLESDLEMVRPLMSIGRMSEDEIATEAVSHVPALKPLVEMWDSDATGFRNLTLTSVGLALGHAYWARLTGRKAPLSIWL